MKTFIALLALVSGLLLVESRADDTEKFCIFPKADAVKMLTKMQQDHGYKIKELTGPAAQAYLATIRQYAEVPELPGVDLLIIYNPGVAAFAVAIKGDKRCGHTSVSWPLHERAINAADRTNV